MSAKTYKIMTKGASLLATSGAFGVMAGAVVASTPIIVTSGVVIGGAALTNILARAGTCRKPTAEQKKEAVPAL